MPRTVPKKDRFFGLFEKLRQPDITGQVNDNYGGPDMKLHLGALSNTVTQGPHSGTHPNDLFYFGILSFQAKLSNATYGASSTVQPASLRLMPIIRI